ncbi:MAG: class I SAM-dependent methyltransferase [Dehalococcoidia bacterium]|nr:class I SAM-dependent methyltransferase [Dehalococcoidia bacterium]
MDHADHVDLLHKGIAAPGGVWADFGAGAGAFTMALAELVGPGAVIYAIDRDARVLRTQEVAVHSRFPGITFHHVVADFARPLALPVLDGIVIANALHFQRDQDEVVRLLCDYLRPGGRVLVVEYNIEHGNAAVPYPVPYSQWESLATNAGLTHTELLATRPSRFLREIYSGASW